MFGSSRSGSLTRLCLAVAMMSIGCFPPAPLALVPVAMAASLAQSTAARLDPLVIVTATGRHPFEVEVARTEAERETGLMYRRSMPQDHGMIFDFKTTQSVMMWMKNTYISLDMVFISCGGVVTHVFRGAEPLSEQIISSGGPVYSVLELNAGMADKIGLAPGDKVENALFPHCTATVGRLERHGPKTRDASVASTNIG